MSLETWQIDTWKGHEELRQRLVEITLIYQNTYEELLMNAEIEQEVSLIEAMRAFHAVRQQCYDAGFSSSVVRHVTQPITNTTLVFAKRDCECEASC